MEIRPEIKHPVASLNLKSDSSQFDGARSLLSAHQNALEIGDEHRVAETMMCLGRLLEAKNEYLGARLFYLFSKTTFRRLESMHWVPAKEYLSECPRGATWTQTAYANLKEEIENEVITSSQLIEKYEAKILESSQSLAPATAVSAYVFFSMAFALSARPGYDFVDSLGLLLGGPLASLKLCIASGGDIYYPVIDGGRQFSGEALGVSIIALSIWALGGYQVFAIARSKWNPSFVVGALLLWGIASAFNIFWFAIRSV
ncbi:MAG: hypothetical protein AAF585_06420 [Verrucomicrobiota bacterium]